MNEYKHNLRLRDINIGDTYVDLYDGVVIPGVVEEKNKDGFLCRTNCGYRIVKVSNAQNIKGVIVRKGKSGRLEIHVGDGNKFSIAL